MDSLLGVPWTFYAGISCFVCFHLLPFVIIPMFVQDWWARPPPTPDLSRPPTLLVVHPALSAKAQGGVWPLFLGRRRRVGPCFNDSCF